MKPDLLIKLFVCLTATFLISTASFAVTDASAPKTVIVLDSSGSMWKQIDGKTKMNIAKEVIYQLLEKWDPKIELGIIAYGHREKGNCDDIETLVDIKKVDKAEIIAAIKNIRPKGKTPISKAVRMAAEHLKYIEEKAVVILLSDGGENCQEDPCELAAELEESGIDFTVHLVGFDIKDEEQKELKCIAEVTGGEYFQAEDAAQLHEAMAASVKMVAKPVQDLKPRPVSVKNTKAEIIAKSKPEKKPEPVKEPEPEKKTEISTGHLILHAKMSEDREPLKNNVLWHIYSNDKARNKKEIVSKYTISPDFILPQGTYIVTAEYGKARAETKVDVRGDWETKKTVNFNFGRLKLHAKLSKDSDMLENNVFWRIYRNNKYTGKKEEIVSKYTTYPYFNLSPGRYTVTAEYSKATAEADVQIIADRETEYTISFNCGSLRLHARLSEKGDILRNSIFWRIFTDEKDVEDRVEVVSKYAISPYFLLAPGTYVIATEYGKAMSETKVDILPDHDVEKTVNLNCGSLKLQARMSEKSAVIKDSILWRVFTNEKDPDKRKKIDVRGAISPEFILSQGTYIVLAEYGLLKNRAEVNIPAGRLTEHTILLTE